jgi:hypothetical protein
MTHETAARRRVRTFSAALVALTALALTSGYGCRGDTPSVPNRRPPNSPPNWDSGYVPPANNGLDSGAPVAPIDGGPVRLGMPEAAAARAEELAILAPLTIGRQVEGAVIEHISRVVNGRIYVYVRRGPSRGTYAVMLNGPGTDALLRAGRYVVYVHGDAVPALFPVGPAIVAALNTHQDAPAPAGLAVFSMQPVPAQR